MGRHGRLTLAALASVALHALLISGAWFTVPRLTDSSPPLEARLAPAPPPPRAATSAPRTRQPTPPRAREAVAITEPPSPSARTAPTALPADNSPATEPEAVAEPAAPNVERPPAVASTPEPPPAVRLPKKGRITYELTFGSDRFSVGKAVQSWELNAEDYMLANEAETTGIVDVFRPQRLRSLSRGRITRNGLKPASFMTSRTRRGQTEAAQASFNWEAGSLSYGSARERASAPLPAGAQDLMSFVYQLAIAPPAPGSYRLPITTGTRFDTFDIQVMGEESIETPLGVVRALPVKQVPRAGAESIEIWLAAEYRYLPVKIRYFDRQGNPTVEQVASEIRISDE